MLPGVCRAQKEIVTYRMAHVNLQGVPERTGRADVGRDGPISLIRRINLRQHRSRVDERVKVKRWIGERLVDVVVCSDMMRYIPSAGDGSNPISCKLMLQAQTVTLNLGGRIEVQVLAVDRLNTRGGRSRSGGVREAGINPGEGGHARIIDPAEIAAIRPRRNTCVGDAVAASQGGFAVPEHIPGETG